MIKYAKIINQSTKLCEVGLGTNSKFYQYIGMTQMDVEQAYNGQWYLVGYAPMEPEKTQEELLKEYENAVQKHLDETAQSKGYDSTYTCLSYLNSTDETWKSEANIFNAWRDLIWRTCHEILNEYLSGSIEAPSIDELISQLPKIEW